MNGSDGYSQASQFFSDTDSGFRLYSDYHFGYTTTLNSNGNGPGGADDIARCNVYRNLGNCGDRACGGDNSDTLDNFRQGRDYAVNPDWRFWFYDHLDIGDAAFGQADQSEGAVDSGGREECGALDRDYSAGAVCRNLDSEH